MEGGKVFVIYISRTKKKYQEEDYVQKIPQINKNREEHPEDAQKNLLNGDQKDIPEDLLHENPNENLNENPNENQDSLLKDAPKDVQEENFKKN